MLVAFMGRRNSSLRWITSLGWQSVMVMRPSPILLLPDQAIEEPGPDSGPLKVLLALGSNLAQGDQASHLRRLFTLAKTTSAGAAIRPVRVTRKSAGRVATMTMNNTTITAIAIRMMLSMEFSSMFVVF